MSIKSEAEILPEWFHPDGLEVKVRQTDNTSVVTLEEPNGTRLMIFRRLDRVGGMYQVNWSTVFPHEGYLKGKLFFELEDLREAFMLERPINAPACSLLENGLYYRFDRFLIIPDVRCRSTLRTSIAVLVTAEIQEAVHNMIGSCRRSGT